MDIYNISHGPYKIIVAMKKAARFIAFSVSPAVVLAGPNDFTGLIWPTGWTFLTPGPEGQRPLLP